MADLQLTSTVHSEILKELFYTKIMFFETNFNITLKNLSILHIFNIKKLNITLRCCYIKLATKFPLFFEV